MIKVTLDSVRQDLSNGTYRTVGRARCLIPGSRSHVESQGYGENLRKVCEALVKMGITGSAEVVRGSMQVFSTPIDIEFMAEGRLIKAHMADAERLEA